ncbi:response regulator [Lysobacter rhizosphaerae]
MSGSRRVEAELRSPTLQAEPIVYVVDDDVSVRESLKSFLETAGLCVQPFTSAWDFLATPHAQVPGCLVLDVSLPDLNGLELQQRIADDRAELPIVFITGCGDVPMTVRAMKAGAIEFLTKPLDTDALLRAVTDAIELSRQVLADAAEASSIHRAYATLSRRERQVMTLVLSGLLNKQVASELGISEITVKAHRGKVMHKMGARSLADLFSMALALRLRQSPAPPDAPAC